MRKSLPVLLAALLIVLLPNAASAAPEPSPAPAPPPSAPATDSAAPSSEPASPESSTEPAPSESASPSSAASESTPSESAAPTATATAAASNDPWGYLEASAYGDYINVDGYAIDPDNMNAPLTVIVTIDGAIEMYHVANNPSPELAPYGIGSPHGILGSIKARSTGAHEACLYIANIGAGSSVWAGCATVDVKGASAEGYAAPTLQADGNIRVTGYAYDLSEPQTSIYLWVTDNGNIVGTPRASAAAPSLTPYGIWGSHGIDYTFTPTATGQHDVCVYALNVGLGQSQWLSCTSMNVPPNAARDNPKGDFNIVGNRGGITVSGWAYDINDTASPVTVMWTVDGAVTAYSIANQPSSYLWGWGVGGEHGVYAGLRAGPGAHEVCMFLGNLGPGASALTKCAYTTVTAGWINPAPSARYTSCFCARWGAFHYGIDLAAPNGTPMYAAADGQVVAAGYQRGYGNWVVIQHPNDGNVYTMYGHMRNIYVSVGQWVSSGQHIADISNAGDATGNHLHFEVWMGPNFYENRVDPAKFLADRGVALPPMTA